MSHNIPTSRRLDRTEGRQARPGNERPSRSVGRTLAGITRDRWDADSRGVPRWGRRVPVSRCDRESRIPGSSRMIPAYPGLKLLIDLVAPQGSWTVV